jgi:UDP-glucuronate 4-epimerase
MSMKMGDVQATWAEASLMLTGYRPQTAFHEGIARLVASFGEYYKK